MNLRENRRYERVHLGFRCWFEGQDITVYAQVGNLSEGGVQLKMSVPVEPGAPAVLRMPVGDGTAEFCTPARVVWTQQGGQGTPPSMGLMFEPLPNEVRQRLRRVIQEESPPMQPV
jgi:uncharacterized protein (TIGR02266 family)